MRVACLEGPLQRKNGCECQLDVMYSMYVSSGGSVDWKSKRRRMICRNEALRGSGSVERGQESYWKKPLLSG